MKRIALIALVVALLAGFIYFDVASFLTLSQLKSSQEALQGWYSTNPLEAILVFGLVYIALTAVAFPGAAILTMAAGAIFGLVGGVVIVSFASTIGATISFLLSRYLFRDTVERRLGARLNAINAGLERDGGFYLFSIRLVPVIPFFAVNLLMGLTKLKARTFFWVSQVGMLLGTIVYVNAGTQLSRVQQVSDILSPALLASFVALGLLPWIGRWLMALVKRRRLYAQWDKPKRFDRNLIVIGGGAAGLVSSYIAASVKAKVTLVEASKMGGDCLNYGCVPSKALIKSARVADQVRHADRYGLVSREPKFSFKQVMQRVHKVIAEVEPHDSVERYTDLGVEVAQGYARIRDPWTVEIAHYDGTVELLTTRSIIIAAGAEPVVPDLPGLEESGYLTSDTLWDEFARLDAIPARITVLGGGPIGSELSQALARLGAKVTQVEMGDRLLAREDVEVSRLIEKGQIAAGVAVLTGHKALGVKSDTTGRNLVVEGPDGETSVPFDALILAIGRKARLSGYGLEELGVETKGTVVTDQYLATLFPNIYAAGDVAGPYQFTHTAAHQAWFASVNALFGQFWRFKADYRVIPWTTFVDPEVARVGLNEQEAHKQGIAHEVTVFPLHELDRAIAESSTTGFVKVLTPPGKDRILGVTIVGDHAGELLAEYVLAMKYRLGLNKILGTIHTYPTMAEANKYAAGEWKKKHAPKRILQLLGRYHRWRRG